MTSITKKLLEEKNNSTSIVAELNSNSNDNTELKLSLEYKRLEKLFNEKSLLTAEDLQYTLAFGKDVIYRMLNDDTFAIIKINGRKYVSLSGLAEWLAGCS